MEKKILEGNKIIAQFMGGKLKYYNISNAPYYLMPNKQQWMPERLVYHTSWDWIIPACKKFCNDIGDEMNNKDIAIYDAYINHCESIEGAVIKFDIMPVFKCLTDAIHWHNSQ